MKPETTINITLRGRDQRWPVECFYRTDDLAVTPSQEYFAWNNFKRGYVVTHIQSGCKIEPTVFNKRVAIKFCRGLSGLYDWKKVSPQNARRLHGLKKKIRSLQRRLKLPQTTRI